MASKRATGLERSDVPRVNHKGIDFEGNKRAYDACMGLASKLEVLKGLPPPPDHEQSRTDTIYLKESAENYIVLQTAPKLPVFVLLAKNPSIAGSRKKGWWLLGYVHPGGSAINVSGNRDSEISLTICKDGGPCFPREAGKWDSLLLDEFARNGRPHPYTVFSCMMQE